jgi:hypothetical protein
LVYHTIEKLIWTVGVIHETLYQVKEERNILFTENRSKAEWFGHILCRNCLVRHIIEGMIEGRIVVAGRWGRKRKNLLNDLKENTGYWKLKEEELDHNLWRACLRRGCGK